MLHPPPWLNDREDQSRLRPTIGRGTLQTRCNLSLVSYRSVGKSLNRGAGGLRNRFLLAGSSADSRNADFQPGDNIWLVRPIGAYLGEIAWLVGSGGQPGKWLPILERANIGLEPSRDPSICLAALRLLKQACWLLRYESQNRNPFPGPAIVC